MIIPKPVDEIRLCRDLGIADPSSVCGIEIEVRPGYFPVATIKMKIPDDVIRRLFGMEPEPAEVPLALIPREPLPDQVLRCEGCSFRSIDPDIMIDPCRVTGHGLPVASETDPAL